MTTDAELIAALEARVGRFDARAQRIFDGALPGAIHVTEEDRNLDEAAAARIRELTRPLDDGELTEIERLCEKATPGPWEYRSAKPREIALKRPNFEMGVRNGRGLAIIFLDDFGSEANAAFIAGSRTAIPTLLREIRRLQSEKADLLAMLEDEAKGAVAVTRASEDGVK